MRRLMIQPTQFGANSGYTWDEADDASAVEAHHDYCALYSTDYSIRLWEPGRMKFSSPGIYGTGAEANQAPELPMRAEIHGIKGAIYIRFDGTTDCLGTWFDDTNTPYVIQPSWLQTMAALSGMPNFAFDAMGPNFGVDMNPGFKMPLFVTMYRGTYKQIDTTAGWEIDSGPADDPDTLLSIDISNPQVLESSRIDWWDMDMVRLPHIGDVRPDSLSFSVAAGLPQQDQENRQYWYPNSGSMHKYSIDLKSNKLLGPDQVLWLHIRTGCIRLPVALPAQEGTGAPTLTCAYYKGHRFSISVQGSMLVTAKVAT